MKFKLLHGRSGVPVHHIMRSRFTLALALGILSAPAIASNDVPGIRTTDVQVTTAGAIGNSVVKGFEASALPDGLNLMPASTAVATPAPVREGRVQTLLKRALALLGTPYRWGGTTPESGFDCSGLVGYVYRNNLGIELPRISRDMARVGELIRDRDALAEGDIVFFSRKGKHVDHVGIYLGNGQFLHAPRTGKDVEIASLASGYWSQKFLQARRVAPQAPTLAQAQ